MTVALTRAAFEAAPARLPGPLDREHFLDAQRRHRRATWRAAAIGIPAVMAAGIPLCVIVTPVLLAPFMVAAFVLEGLGLLSPGAWTWVHQAAHILPDTWAALWNGTPIAWGVLAAVFVAPGAVTMFGVWLALRLLLGRAWIPSVLSRLGARPADRRRLAERTLCNIAEELAVAAAVPPPRVFLVDSGRVNAAVVGHEVEEAVLVVSTGLLETMDRAETQALVAHLIASVGNGDMRIAATFFAIFEAWGAMALMTEIPFSREARGALRRMALALRRAAAGRCDPEEARAVADELLEGAGPISRGFDEYMERIEYEWRPLRNLLVDLPILVTSCIFSITARLTVTLCTILLFAPPLSALWRARRKLADSAAVELTRQPAALASAVEKLHAADVELPGGHFCYFLFHDWPRIDPEKEQTEVAGHVLGMQLDPHKRLQDLRPLGSGREVTIPVSGWEGWRKELKDLPILLSGLAVALPLLALMFAVSLAA
ncbi:MAG TPA: M48 family metalloprotease, partial [Allosphingosinicella sp.]